MSGTCNEYLLKGLMSRLEQWGRKSAFGTSMRSGVQIPDSAEKLCRCGEPTAQHLRSRQRASLGPVVQPDEPHQGSWGSSRDPALANNRAKLRKTPDINFWHPHVCVHICMCPLHTCVHTDAHMH